jgi:sec-independent protein translocase protein TatA
VEGKALGGLSTMHWLVVLLVILVVFGAGKLPRLMGDLGMGIKNFKRTMQEGEEPETSLTGPATADERRPVETR